MQSIFFFSLQLVALRSMKYNSTVDIENNYRPVQDLNGRKVYVSYNITTIPTTTTTTTTPSTEPPVITDGVARKISNVALLLMLLLGAVFFH